MKSQVMLWSGIILGPVAWFINLEANFAIAPLACTATGKPYLYLVSAVSLVTAIVAGAVSFACWHMLERSLVAEGAPGDSGRRFVALSGIILSAFCALVIIAQSIPNILFKGCE